MDRAGQTYYYVQDDLMSVIALTSEAGTVVETIDYMDYGEPIIREASGTIIEDTCTGNPYGFLGMRKHGSPKQLAAGGAIISTQSGTFLNPLLTTSQAIVVPERPPFPTTVDVVPPTYVFRTPSGSIVGQSLFRRIPDGYEELPGVPNWIRPGSPRRYITVIPRPVQYQSVSPYSSSPSPCNSFFTPFWQQQYDYMLDQQKVKINNYVETKEGEIPMTCTEQEHKELSQRKGEACRKPSKCKETMDCAEILARLQSSYECYMARYNLQQKCFNYPFALDKSHKGVFKERGKNYRDCLSFAMQKKCIGPLPPSQLPFPNPPYD